MSGVSPEDFRAAMGSFAAGVTIVTSKDVHGNPVGLTATAFSSVSIAPPTCLVCVAHAAEAYPSIDTTGRLAVNMLSEGSEELSALFATSRADKFAGLEWDDGPALGCPVLRDCLAFVECTISHKHAIGDHEIFYGIVESAEVRPGAPLVYFRGRYRVLSGT